VPRFPRPKCTFWTFGFSRRFPGESDVSLVFQGRLLFERNVFFFLPSVTTPLASPVLYGFEFSSFAKVSP